MSATQLLRNPAILLVIFALIGSTLVAYVFDETAVRIAANEHAALLQTLNELIPADSYDNALLLDKIEVHAPHFLGSLLPANIYRARKAGQPVAAVLNVIAPDGYNGRISLLVAIKSNGELGGVRVVTHRETPGLGDGIDSKRSDWALQFDEKSLIAPKELAWKVRKDGGEFDQLTGATISPRAIVKAVKNALLYFKYNQDEIFAPIALPDESSSPKKTKQDEG